MAAVYRAVLPFVTGTYCRIITTLEDFAPFSCSIVISLPTDPSSPLKLQGRVEMDVQSTAVRGPDIFSFVSQG